MQSLYRTLLEVEIRHDYFQLLVAGTKYPDDYDISAFVEIVPSIQTSRIMKDHRMRFKGTKTGFTIYAETEFISVVTGHATLVDLEPDLYLSFYWRLHDHRLVNYTNLQLKEPVKKIYYFSNRSASQQGGIRYLNQAIPPFGTTYPGETTAYHLGDIVSQGGQTFELIEMESPTVNFPGNITKWKSINPVVTNYVNPFDRLTRQSSKYQHERLNNNPGEFITYDLTDVDGNFVPLQNIPGTSLSQSDYRAPVSATDKVNHTLDLDHVDPGKYTLTINEIGGPTIISFYLQDEISEPDLFAVSEFFVSGSTLPFQFITKNVAINRWILDDPGKLFLLRFRPRLTRWKYLKQDQTLFHQAPDPRPLTKTYSDYSIVVGPNTIHLPDPPVDPIIPEIDVGTKLLKNIYSQIFLIN
jgi:hypothetical protein